MLNLTEQQIADAKDNDLEAVTAVATATEDRVTYLAHCAATSGGKTDRDLKEDLAQEGRMALWLALSRFQGTTVAQFFTFMDRTVKGAISDARKREVNQGVSRDAAACFEYALSLTERDPYEAEEIASIAEVMGDRKLSPELAYAARLAYMGLDYLDAPMPESDSGEYTTLGDTIAATTGIPEELLESSDFVTARQQATRQRVHDVLNRMGGQQRTVLMALTGIDPVAEYGATHDDDLAADYDLPRDRVSSIRARGKDRFAELYRKACA